ncbi:MAG: helix-turn-helix domain-containing protein [Dehalococcoidia bacterium]|nr:helix-turn-helix domain-containing protein [Dehalococcoidia bacterium]
MGATEKERPLVYSVAEAAEACSVSKVLMYQMIREGRIPAIRISARRLVVPRRKLEQLIEGEVDCEVEDGLTSMMPRISERVVARRTTKTIREGE